MKQKRLLNLRIYVETESWIRKSVGFGWDEQLPYELYARVLCQISDGMNTSNFRKAEVVIKNELQRNT